MESIRLETVSFCALKWVMGRVIRVAVLIQKVIGRAVRVRQQRVERLLLDLRIARNRARLADERATL
jgi:hypothetical protein